MIRHTLPEDRAPIQDILQENLGSFFNEAEVEIAIELLDQYLDNLEAEKEYLHLTAISRTGEIGGYVCYGPVPLTDSSWDLYWIAVRTAHRRDGLGRKLIRAVEEDVLRRGGTALYVDTSGREGYAPTRLFYERLGYSVATRLEDFYRPGDDKVVYRKRLARPGLDSRNERGPADDP